MIIEFGISNLLWCYMSYFSYVFVIVKFVVASVFLILVRISTPRIKIEYLPKFTWGVVIFAVFVFLISFMIGFYFYDFCDIFIEPIREFLFIYILA